MLAKVSTNSQQHHPGVIYREPFVPLPWQVGAWNDQSSVLLLTGSAGGGKSILATEKIVAFCMKYPGAQCLIMRKTQEDLFSSVIPTIDDHVIGDIEKHPDWRKVKSERCYIYTFPDGRGTSRIWWRGIKGKSEREKLRSIGSRGSLDMVFMEEGIEYEEDDFNAVTSRMRGNAGGWRQIIVATNPGPPLHWINRRLIIGGEASVHISAAADNPHNPPDYVERLLTMTGVEKARLALGLWVEGSGRVIDTYENKFNKGSGSDNGGNVSLKAEYVPDGGRVVAMVDDGYVGEWDEKSQMFTEHSHPRVFLLGQIRSNGQLCVFYENYRIKTSFAEHIDEVLEDCRLNGWRVPRVVYYDKSAAALRGALHNSGFSSLYPSPSSREESIKILKENCAADANGFRNVLIHPRCHQLNMEMSSWSLVDGRASKYFDHGPDALRYGVWHIFGGLQVSIGHTQQENIDVTNRIESRMKKINEIYAKVEERMDRELPILYEKRRR